MKRFANNLPVIDRINNGYKNGKILTYAVTGGITVHLILLAGLGFSLSKMKLYPLGIAVLLAAAVAAYTVYSCSRIKNQKGQKRIHTMMNLCGLTTEEELEAILEKSKPLSPNYYLSDTMILNFANISVIRLNEITSVKLYQREVSDGEESSHTEYGLDISLDIGENDILIFPSVKWRNQAYELITHRKIEA